MSHMAAVLSMGLATVIPPAALAVEGNEARAENSRAVGTNRADLKGGE